MSVAHIPVNLQSSEFLGKLDHLEDTLHPWDIDLTQWHECGGTVPGRFSVVNSATRWDEVETRND